MKIAELVAKLDKRPSNSKYINLDAFVGKNKFDLWFHSVKLYTT